MVRVLSVLIVALLVAQPAYASDPLALVLLKAMSYERGLASRVGESVVIAVPVPEGRTSPRFLKSLMRVTKVRLAQKAISVARIDYADSAALKRRLESLSADFVFLSSELSNTEIAAVLQTCENLNIPTISVEKSLVERGVSLGVELVGKKPRIFVNPRSASLQGANYSSDLLELSVLVR